MECRKKGDLGERHSGSNEIKYCPNPNQMEREQGRNFVIVQDVM